MNVWNTNQSKHFGFPEINNGAIILKKKENFMRSTCMYACNNSTYGISLMALFLNRLAHFKGPAPNKGRRKT